MIGELLDLWLRYMDMAVDTAIHDDAAYQPSVYVAMQR
jgi:hypothetical protein